ncbi:MAG: PIN domain-containing protein [Tepidisphaeraceae bacterium]
MILHVLRALFVLLMAAVGWAFIKDPELGPYNWLSLAVAIVVGVLIVCLDILAPRKKLAVFSGAFLGLIVGISIAYALSFVVALLVDQYMAVTEATISSAMRDGVVQFINLLVGVVACYLSISFIMQTKDDFRFVIPYVEFNKQTKGARPILLDTSVLIDGRITEIANTGILESQLVVPRFVLAELQAIADSGDKLKRNRGRRGLDVLSKLQANERVEVRHYDTHEEGIHDVDQRLMALATELNARVLTNDFNLNKVAQLRGVDVININDLANALKPDALPGEKMIVRLLKPGEEPGQGVGYLDDGTMVVVEQGRPHLNEEVEFTVTNTRQTSAGRMIFGRLGDGQAGGPPARRSPPPPHRPRNESQQSPA